MVVSAFCVINMANRIRFFKETFLVANISPEVVFGILFLNLSSIKIDFSGRELRWRTYITKKALLTTRRIEPVGRKEFATVALDLVYETYVNHVGSFSSITLASSSPLKLNFLPFHKH